MRRTATIIIGGGQAGLAMSRHLSDRGIDHVVLERGRVGERWRTERWDSLRLLTPNWMARLPGRAYEGPDPDGFMTMPEVTSLLEGYATSFDAPVVTGTTVERVESCHPGYRVQTDRGVWQAPHVVLATGYCDKPWVPPMSRELSGQFMQLAPPHYRHPGQLPDGGVLVVGASSSGVQLADEIHASGRPVTLAVGRHTRLPRTYRGRDILFWMDRMGILSETTDRVFDIERSRRQPSLQLVGRPDHQSLGLRELGQRGVRIMGRAVEAGAATMTFDDDLVANAAAADYKLAGVLQRIDQHIEREDLTGDVDPREPFVPSWQPLMKSSPTLPATLDLQAESINTIIWATGFTRSYPWLQVPVLDDRGEIMHREGVTPAPGLYVLGMQFQRQRRSAFIDGVGDDAAYLTRCIDRSLASARDTRTADCGCEDGGSSWLHA